jgi:hypothetical protein
VLKRWRPIVSSRCWAALRSVALRIVYKQRTGNISALHGFLHECVSHRMLVNCGTCKMLQCVWKVSVKLFRINGLSLCMDSVGFAVTMNRDYYVSLILV